MSGLPVAIRDAWPRDLDDMQALGAQTFTARMLPARDELSLRLRLASIALVATQADHLRGYLLAFSSLDVYEGGEFRHFSSQVDTPFIFIEQLAVAAAAQGQGVALQMYERVRQVARRRCVFTLGAGVPLYSRDPDSLAFFRRLGFVRFDEIATPEGPPVALLRKDLC